MAPGLGPRQRRSWLRSGLVRLELVLLAILAVLVLTALRIGMFMGTTQGSLPSRRLLVPSLEAEKTIRLHVCIVTADYWGKPGAGGTATAYHMLAQTLATSSVVAKVSVLAAAVPPANCPVLVYQGTDISLQCLQPGHFMPSVVQTYGAEALSKAVLAWVQQADCSVVHAHEWGGVITAVAVHVSLRQGKPGLRLAVQTHGGHLWSNQDMLQRPLDLTSLRVDHQERMTLQLADYVLSPTQYMLSCLRLRGWRLPTGTRVLPNVLDVPADAAGSAHTAGSGRIRKPVWRLAFYARLEARKGIQMFVDAVSALNLQGLERFEVWIIGSDAEVGGVPSSAYLRARTGDWPFPVHMLISRPRAEALAALQQEGMLLVMASSIENMPYVVAEAALLGMPFVTLSVGGIREMLDTELYGDMLIKPPFGTNLQSRLADILQQGSALTAQLSPAVTSGREQWLAWHAEYAAQSAARVAADEREQQRQADALAAWQADAQSVLEVVRVSAAANAQAVKRLLCKGVSVIAGRGTAATGSSVPSAAVLLLPEGYELRPTSEQRMVVLVSAMHGAQNQTGTGALVFGAVLPDGRVSYPVSPTWMLYDGDGSECSDSVPVLVRRDVFCSTFWAETGDFAQYSAWVLSGMLGRAGLQMQTYPDVLFTMTSFSQHSRDCRPSSFPNSRQIRPQTAANMYRDAEDLLRDVHLAPWPKPVASLVADWSGVQGHRGWQYLCGPGAMDQDRSESLYPLQASPSQGLASHCWGCPGGLDNPSLRDFLVQPAVLDGGLAHPDCCGSASAIRTVIRFQAYLALVNGTLRCDLEAFPVCGDGLDVHLMVHRSQGPAETLLSRACNVAAEPGPERIVLEQRMSLNPGDVIELSIDPRSNHACDGVLVNALEIWKEPSLTGRM